MIRKYQNHNMVQLERLFAIAAPALDLAVLNGMRDELQIRTTRKAKELLGEVAGAIARAETAKSGKASDQGQLELPVLATEPAPVAPAKPSPPAPAPLAVPVKVPPARSGPSAPVAPIGPQEAAKLLGVTFAARWEFVEAARVRLVRDAVFSSREGAQPDREAARRINAAYASLAVGRRY